MIEQHKENTAYTEEGGSKYREQTGYGIDLIIYLLVHWYMVHFHLIDTNTFHNFCWESIQSEHDKGIDLYVCFPRIVKEGWFLRNRYQYIVNALYSQCFYVTY